MEMFILLESIEKTPPTMKLNKMIQFINFVNPDLLTIISFVEEIKIRIKVKK
ncbi:hypothetical protein AB4668_14175 [Clostridium sp. HCS.1]